MAFGFTSIVGNCFGMLSERLITWLHHTESLPVECGGRGVSMGSLGLGFRV